VLGGLAAVAVLLCVWYGAGIGPLRVRDLLYWPLQPPLDLLFVVGCQRVRRTPGVTPAERRFWGGLRNACAIFFVADAYLASAVLAGHPDGWVSADVHGLLFVLGVQRVVWTTLRHPVRWSGPGGGRNAHEHAPEVGGTATMVGLWLLAAAPPTASGLVLPALGAALMLLTVFGLGKLLLGGDPPFTRGAGLGGALTGVLYAGSLALPPALLTELGPDVAHLAWLSPGVLMAALPRLQELGIRRRDPGDAGTPRDRDRAQSWLPYIALTATQGLLVVAVVGAGAVDRAVVGAIAGVSLIIGIVVVRQVTVLRDNAALVSRLDASLHELAGFQDRLWHEARHDQLTQLANRTLLHERIQAALASSGPEPEPAALLLLDLDRFKAVNDTLGHHVGDALLVHVAEQLRAQVRASDTVARLGGDEFVVLMPGATERDAQALAHRLRTAFLDRTTIEGHDLDVAASIGIATGRLQDAETLLRRADADMYRAKQLAHVS
jgi:diguanylate cyclase (GGDEF)-like protein